MNKLITSFALILLLALTGFAQLPADKKEAAPALTQSQQQQLAQAVEAAQTAQLQAEAAKARAEATAAQVQALAFKFMALLKLSPDEFDLRPASAGGFELVAKPKTTPQK